MNNAFLTTVLTALGILSLSSCVDPTYYEGGYSSSGSATFTTLPHGYSTIYDSGNPYYYHGGNWAPGEFNPWANNGTGSIEE